MKFESQISEITSACARLDRAGAEKASESLACEIRATGTTFLSSTASPVIQALIRKRWFNEALCVAEAVIESGQGSESVRLDYAQALIDSGRLAAALPLLQQLLTTAVRRSRVERAARGSIGRIYKQLYVNGAGEPELRADRILRSFNAYFDAYDESPLLHWHGINALAVFARAERDGIRINATPPDARVLLDAAAQSDSLWSHAIAGEAAIALGDTDLAYRHYRTYADSDDERADAFEIASSLRQLIEVWELTSENDPGARILPMLHGALLRKQGGLLELQGNSVRTELEKTFGSDAAVSFNWYRQGLERCLSVCCVRHERGDAWGTGFIVRGDDFGFTDELLMLTNEHVLSETSAEALRPGKAYATFEALPNRPSARCVEIVWSSRAFDATLARFDPPLTGVTPIAIERELELPESHDDTTRVYLIGHPHGGGLAFSLHDNLVAGWDDERVHYRAPTEHGSSGSPVFDDQWRLIALHHGGGRLRRLDDSGGFYEANEGFRIDRIRAAASAR